MTVAERRRSPAGKTWHRAGINVEEASAGTKDVSRNIHDISRHIRQSGQMASQVLVTSESIPKKGTVLAEEVQAFLLSLRRGPLDRRNWDAPNFKGPERREDRRQSKGGPHRHPPVIAPSASRHRVQPNLLPVTQHEDTVMRLSVCAVAACAFVTPAAAQQPFPATLAGHALIPAATSFTPPKDAPADLAVSGKFAAPDRRRVDGIGAIAGTSFISAAGRAAQDRLSPCRSRASRCRASPASRPWATAPSWC